LLCLTPIAQRAEVGDGKLRRVEFINSDDDRLCRPCQGNGESRFPPAEGGIPMQITDESGEQVNGQAADQFLQAELAVMAANSAAAAALLNPLFGNPAVTVVIKSVDKRGDQVSTAAHGLHVTINPRHCLYANGVLKADGPQEFAETAIFELTNVSHAANYAQIDTDVTSAQITPLRYGRDKSDIEADATWTVSTVVTQRMAGGYQPSAWGLGQVNSTANFATLALYRASFAQQPHKAGDRGVAGLPTEEFYAETGTKMLVGSGTPASFTNVVTLTKGGRTVHWGKVASRLTQSNTINSRNSGSVKFYRAALTIAADPAVTGAGYATTWRPGTVAGSWSLTPAIEQHSPDPADWIDQIRRLLTGSQASSVYA
jgi:hypothetical protein